MNRLWWRYPIRMWRLKHGFCPLCNSSPPDKSCPVCYGTYMYGNQISEYRQKKWLEYFEQWHLQRRHNL